MEDKLEEIKRLSLYDDYGDLTGMQTIRRLIKHINNHFKSVNASINEIISVVNELSDIVHNDNSETVEGLVTQMEQVLLDLEEKADKTE